MHGRAASSLHAAFLAGGGECGRLIAERDWPSTALGPIEGWPQSLRTVLGVLLRSPVPLVLLWGEAGVMLYNDAYSVFAGGRHPGQLGRPVREGWPEVAAFNDHVMEVCLAGDTLSYRDQELTLHRHGRPEPVCMNLDYSPVPGEDGRPAGVLAVVVETTARVVADRRRQEAEAALRAEHERAQGVLDNMGEAFALLDRDLRILDMNAEALRLEHRPREEVVGLTHHEAHPDADPALARLYRDAFDTGRPTALEHRHEWGDGRVSWIDMRAYPVGDRVAVFYRDATDRKEAEAALRASEEFNRRVLRASADCIKVLDLQGRLEFMSEGGMGVMEVDDVAAIQGTSWPDTWQGEEHAKALAAVQDARRGGTGRFQGFARTMKGSPRWWDVVVSPINGPDGSPEKLLVVSRDVTATKGAEERLRGLADTLEAQVAERTAERDRMWETSPDLMLVSDFAGVFRRVNPAWTAILGYAPEELVGHHVNEFVLPDDHRETTAAYEMAADGGRPRIENRFLHKDGSVRWISWTAAPAGEVTYATGRDVTAAKERQAELEAAQDALRQAQKMEAVGQLTGGLAHDFNNLLAGISGSLELAGKRVAQGRTAELGRYLDTAQEAAQRAAALTQRLLAFSRRQTLDPKPTDANRLVQGMEELVRRTAGPGIAVEVVATDGLWTTLVDPHQLENALLNLSINARDAMPDGGRLTIETTNRVLDGRAARSRDLPPGQYVSVCVSDTGLGMAPEVVARAFDPFFTTKPLGQGTGLGLSMVYGFARQSHGQARIHSEVGRGTTVCLYLPHHPGSAAEAAEAETGQGEAPRARAGETVLVVDDEPAVRMLMRDVLEELGYAALEADDGASGLGVLRSDARVDLLVSDVGLPGGMNGRQMADLARQTRPDLKVLFITGYAEAAVVSRSHLDPGMHVVTKPFNLDDLARRIRELTTDADDAAPSRAMSRPG